VWDSLRPAGSQVNLAVLLADVDGEALCDKAITWSLGANSGSVSPARSMTNDSGAAASVWTLGPAAGTQTVTATVENSIPTLTVTFTVTATPPPALHPVHVTVTGSGSGGGHVSSSDAGTSINCDFPSSAGCSATIMVADGGSFTLSAAAASGSGFTGWTGCPSASGSVCTISYTAGGASDFTINARFDLSPGSSTNTISLYNGLSGNANIVVGLELPVPANSLGPSGMRSVLVATAIGTVVSVRAYISGEQVASTTCTVSAAAWVGTTYPVVGLFYSGSYGLTCYNF
jgi:hypothetical protein